MALNTDQAETLNETPEAAPLRFLFALPGFHQEERGAEVALLSVAEELAKLGDQVTVIGAGEPRAGTSYAYRQAKAINRRKLEWLPKIPPFRSETVWEDASFSRSLKQAYDPSEFDIALTCNFPFSHWTLRRHGGANAPLHVFVTQNGDWPASSDKSEFKHFSCDGLVCTNPDYERDNAPRWRTALIPNGINPERFHGVEGNRAEFGIPEGVLVVLMVSAFIETKRVMDGMRAVAPLDGVHFVCAGDGPMRDEVDALAKEILPRRFTRFTTTADRMATLYRSADTFLHMSLHESFGNVFVEAMAGGLPIVGHDTPRLRWIVGDRETLCDTQDQATLTAKIAGALETGRGDFDPRANEFAWGNIALKYRAFAQDLMAERAKTSTPQQ